MSMETIPFATSNPDKIFIAQAVCSQFGVTIEQVNVDVNEIQGEDPRVIIQDKARRAYEQSGQPLVVSDDSWDIPALNGFPGPYMKSINEWFCPDDFIRLTAGLKDRSIILHEYLCYYNGEAFKIFNNDTHGHIIDKPRGKNDKSPSVTVTVLDCDNGKTIAEVFAQRSKEAILERYKAHPDAWSNFVKWWQTTQSRRD